MSANSSSLTVRLTQIVFGLVLLGLAYIIVKSSTAGNVKTFKLIVAMIVAARGEVHKYAMDIVREKPWFGRKGFRMDLGEVPWAGHALVGNWHSAWHAYMADFGIPCLVFFLYFFLRMFVRSFQVIWAIQESIVSIVNSTFEPLFV